MSYTLGFLPDLSTFVSNIVGSEQPGFFQQALDNAAKEALKPPTSVPGKTSSPTTTVTEAASDTPMPAASAGTDKTGSKVTLALVLGGAVLAFAGVVWFARR